MVTCEEYTQLLVFNHSRSLKRQHENNRDKIQNKIIFLFKIITFFRCHSIKPMDKSFRKDLKEIDHFTGKFTPLKGLVHV